MEYQDGLKSRACSSGFQWVNRYFNSLDDDVSIDEIVDFLVSLKTSLQAKGYQVPSLAELCLKVKDQLVRIGVQLDDDEIDEIYDEILKRESILIDHVSFSFAHSKNLNFKVMHVKKHKQDKDKKEKEEGLKISSDFAKGFMKALAGALLCIIPHPVTLTIGGTLVADGVRDMVQHADDIPDENEIEEKLRNLQRPQEHSLRRT